MASGTADDPGAAGVIWFLGVRHVRIHARLTPQITSSVLVCHDRQQYREQSAVIRAVHQALSVSPQSLETVHGASDGVGQN
jgi:hypothetical protein